MKLHFESFSFCRKVDVFAINCTGMLHISLSSHKSKSSTKFDYEIRDACFMLCWFTAHSFAYGSVVAIRTM